MPAEGGEKQKPEMAWSTLPFVERPLTSVGVLLFLAIILAGIYYWFHSCYWVALAGITLFMSLSAYFVPTRYELYDDHIVVKRFLTTQNKKWVEFKRLYSDRNGAFLSPFDSPNRLENFRGLFLRIPHNRVETLRFLQRKVPLGKADERAEASTGDKAS
ncbi:MAG: hypothetical protein DRH70_00130 [Candidatus Coatesbacteria bacterium]|nr:MAG: hypothetical protein DRH70_00130 [Candidatus Coatesbacteria bacterium]HDM59131.1 hypothetical protein [Bacillota bacterium]